MESKKSFVRVDLFIKFEYYVGLKVYLILNLTPILDSKQFFINLQTKPLYFNAHYFKFPSILKLQYCFVLSSYSHDSNFAIVIGVWIMRQLIIILILFVVLLLTRCHYFIIFIFFQVELPLKLNLIHLH